MIHLTKQLIILFNQILIHIVEVNNCIKLICKRIAGNEKNI